MHLSLFFLGLASLSASPLFVKWAQAPIEFLGFWRLSLATLLLAVFLLIRRPQEFQALFQKRSLAWPLLAGSLFFLHLWTYVFAAQNTSVGHLMILFSTNPLWTMAGATLFFREKVQFKMLISYPLALAGLLVLLQEKVSFAPQSQWGDVMAVVSAVLHAGYLLSTKKSRQNLPNLSFSVLLYFYAALLFAVVGLAREDLFGPTTPQAWGAILGLVVFPTFLGHSLMTFLVSKMNLTVLSFGKLLEPPFASLLAFFLFHETMSWNTVAAFALTGASVMILLWPRQWRWR